MDLFYGFKVNVFKFFYGEIKQFFKDIANKINKLLILLIFDGFEQKFFTDIFWYFLKLLY